MSSNPSTITTATDTTPAIPQDTGTIPQDTGTIATLTGLATTTNLIAVIGFLGIYFVIYFVLGMFFNKGENPSGFNMGLSKTLDLLFLIIISIITYTVYQSYQKNPEIGLFEGWLTNFTTYISNPGSAVTTMLFIIIFYVVVYLFRIPMDVTKPIFVSMIEGAIWLLLIVILFVDFFKYVLKISFYDLFPFLAPAEKPIDPVDTPVPPCEPKSTEDQDDPDSEVFNVSNNKYTYEDAQAICKAYDATLATYDQVEKAYNNGAEWCNYGWSANQMILFPTQKKTWDKLQKLDESRSSQSKAPSHKNDCGRPGVNGGYIANPYARFGVNCFGKKPEASDADKVRMNAKQNRVYPKTPDEQVLENKVNYWKQNADKYLQLNSYSTHAWNQADNNTK